MRPLLEKHKLWDALPSKAEDEGDTDCSDDEGDDNILDKSSFSHEEMTENLPGMQEDVNTLHKNKLITSQATVKLSKLQSNINQESTISVFTKTSGTKDFKEPLQELKSLQKKSPFVEIKSYKETPLYIRKSTAIWLFQEGERVSSDRLFRVRVAQPFSSSTSKCESDSEVIDGKVPFVATQLKTGDLCVFKSTYTYLFKQ